MNAGQAQGYVLCNLAYLARLAGDLDEARMLLDEAVSIFRALGDRDGESMALNHLGCLHRVRAEFAEPDGQRWSRACASGARSATVARSA